MLHPFAERIETSKLGTVTAAPFAEEYVRPLNEMLLFPLTGGYICVVDVTI